MSWIHKLAALGLPLLALLCAAPAAADITDSFDTVRTRWRLKEHDCRARIFQHRQDFSIGHARPGCEMVRIVAAQGTYARIGYPLPSVRLIDELNPSLWLRSDRFDLQLMARVVLPRSINSQTGRPLETVVRGQMYRRQGTWQKLVITSIREKLHDQVASLSVQHRIEVDPGQAYVTELLLNVYGGPGVTTVWIDDLSMTSPLVQAAQQAPHDLSQPVQPASLDRTSDLPVQLDGSLLLAKGRPLMARIIEYNGEPMAWLQQLGFNTLWLKSAATRAQLEEAARLGLWLLAPPAAMPPSTSASAAERILAWDLGEGLAAGQLHQLAELAGSTRERMTPARPLSCGVNGSLLDYQQHVDLLRLDWQPLFSGLPIEQATSQRQQAVSRLRPGTPYWVSLPSQPPEELQRQWNALSVPAALSGQVSLPQLRQVVHRALSVGSRGVLLRSHARLDRADGRQHDRARQLEHLNMELKLVEPWIAGGGMSQRIELDQPGVTAMSLSTRRARMIWIFRSSPSDQLVGAASQAVNVELDPGEVPATYRGLLIGPAGIQQLSLNSRNGAWQVPLDSEVNLVVLSDDPLAVDYLRRTDRRMAERRGQLADQQLQALWQQTSLVMDQLPGPVQYQHQWQQRRQQLNERVAQQLADASDLADLAHQRKAADVARQLRQLRFEVWQASSRAFESPVSSPLCVCFETLPSHWALGRSLAGRDWGENQLSAGECDSLAGLRRAGWKHIRGQVAGISSKVELSAAGARSGPGCIRMVSWHEGQLPVQQRSASAPVWIQTPPVSVQPGDRVKIQGWVRIPRPLDPDSDGLLVYDSVAGPSLALRLHHAPGWRPFVIYRGVEQAQTLQLTLALMDVGEVLLDDISLQLIPATVIPASQHQASSR